MLRVLILLVFTVLRLPAQSAGSDLTDPSGTVLRMLEWLNASTDPAAIKAAGRHLAKDHLPTEAVADSPKPLAPGSNREDLNQLAGDTMEVLGQYIARHPADFPNGLPKISGLTGQRRLGPLFEGMLPHRWYSGQLRTRLEVLNPLIDESWLDASAICGAYDFYHHIQAHRGQIRTMLKSYQDAGDEIGVIRLGEAIGRHAEPTLGIDPREVSTTTLGLLLSGAFGIPEVELTERFTLVNAALGWRQFHPELLNRLVELRGNRSSLDLFEAGDLWRRGERDAALKLLFAKTRGTPWPVATFVNSLLLQANPPDGEVASLARLIPTEVLVSCARQLLDGEAPDDLHVRLGILMMPEYQSRKDRTREHWIPFSMDTARKIALRWWKDGRNEEVLRLLQETFINLSPSDQADDLLRFAAIARVFGKVTSVMDELDQRASKPGYSDLSLKKAALLTVIGKHREALELARTRPSGDLFYRLLVECGNWDELREIAFGPEPPLKETNQWLCHAAFLNKDAATARAYFGNLPAQSKEQTALLLVLSGNDELCRRHANKWIAEQHRFDSLPYPISLNAFDVWENAILDDLDHSRAPLSETVQNYTRHAGMTRNKALTIQILERLIQAGKLRTKIGNSQSPYFTNQLLWQHRIQAAACLIELGTLDQGCRSLQQMAAEGPDDIDGIRYEFWNAFVPARFATNGFAEYLKIAELELPAATKLERHVFLAKTLAGQPVPDAVRRMLALLEKHRPQIPFNDASRLLQKISIALWGEPTAAELRVEAERVFAFYQPNDKQLAFFQRWARPAPWKDQFSYRTEIEQKPGDQHDPKSPGFRVLDGMARVRDLLADQKSAEAESNFRDMEIRILLDELPDEKITVNTLTNQESSGYQAEGHPEAIPVIAAQGWNLQAPFLREYSLTGWRCDWNINPRFLAPFLARNGNFREARIAAIEYQHGWGMYDLQIIRMLPALDGLAHASEGRVDAALERLDVCLNLSPFNPMPGIAILNAFKRRGDPEAVQRTAARIRDYWRQRLAEYPASPQVREASHYWLGELDRSQ